MTYLTSTRHLVGTALALLGLGAYLLGWLGAYWLPIVAGLYLIGVLLTPARTRADVHLAAQASADDLRTELHRFTRRLRGRVPPNLQLRAEHLSAQLQALLPHLAELERRGDPHAFTVRRIITDYLPGTFRNYLRLPRAHRSTPLNGERSPDDLLAEQLDLLSATLDRVTADALRGDTDALIANGRFLQDRFGRPDLQH
ncbi:hypothetical protein [Deinococcus maricopensis]|uniref:5-bromo-4-chloroindolyl phosphate hydrolysis protein n=1 Tax=Deinococcus maricopensis (strain DSM 21211 / LMG 22137 / NRRL B-23946 / LB-34) TaxID=709986 RepID=E8U694_DEIML|nr:hypothetical protein [Deinococcus maricopensis]ADV66583.1 hypothetical protein Deima_0929 [Deinococcus maricopensis DSM 21211]